MGASLFASAADSAGRPVDPWDDAEVMVVVGDGRRGTLVEAPSSVIAFDTEELLATGISDVGDLAEYTPNLEINSVFGASSPEIFIRGVGLKDTSSNAASSVAVISDEVYLNSPVGQLAQFFDVESVNVLRGPQGAKYGRNASAGAILIQSARPSGGFGSRLALTYGRFDQVDFDGHVEAPIVPDLLSLRVSGKRRQRDPLGNNRAAAGRQTPIPNSLNGPPAFGINDRDEWAARGQLLLNPTPGLEILLNVHGGQNRSLAPSFQYAPRFRPNQFTPLWHGSNGYFDFDGCMRLNDAGQCVENTRQPENGDPFEGAYNATPPEDLDLFGTYLRVDGEIGSWLLTSITAFERNSRDAGLDLDVLISDVIGGSTRFKSLEMAATGVAKDTYSRRSENAKNPSEPTPLSLYNRVFGAGFSDPNAGEFVPDPQAILRRSVLSVVGEDRKRIESVLGARDRARLDEYFTSLRQLERQLELQLSAPPPLEACEIPVEPEQGPVSRDVAHVKANHDAMAKVLALALACDQTRVFNMVFSEGASQLHMPGSADTHHTLTHEEARDTELGYQVAATNFVIHSMEAWATFVETLAAVPEGDGSLLDNSVVLAHSETSDANSHSVTGLPIMIAGRAGGRIQSGLHVFGGGDSTARVGLTLQQVMGLNVASWGWKANKTDRPISEILA